MDDIWPRRFEERVNICSVILSRVKLTNAHTVCGRPTPKNNTECFRNGLVRELKEKQRKLSRHSMTSKTHGPHRRNNKSEYQECTCKMDKSLNRGMLNKFESRKICVAGYQCDNSDFDFCIAEHNELPVIKICSDEGRDDCQQLKPKGTETSFGTAVVTVTILFIISILFSRVTVNVLVFVLRVVFFHCQGTSRAKMVDLRGGQQKYCSRPKNYRSCCEKCNVRCRFRGDFSGVRFHV